MRAVVFDRYGSPDVLRVAEMGEPQAKPGQVRIRVVAAAVTSGDCELRRFEIRNVLFWLPLRLLMGLRRPRRPMVPGFYVAGVIDALGEGVTAFENGDEVFGTTAPRPGSYAEYVCVAARGSITRKPVTIGFEEAAAAPLGGLNALHFIRRAALSPGQRMLINGAGGAIGTFAMQLARRAGAKVTAVDAAAKLDMLRSAGADRVLDYASEDVCGAGETYDVILDVVGSIPFRSALGALAAGGRLLLGNPRASDMLRGWLATRTGARQVISDFAGESREDLEELAGMLARREVQTILDRTFPLERAADAHRYVEAGHKQGNVVLVVMA